MYYSYQYEDIFETKAEILLAACLSDFYDMVESTTRDKYDLWSTIENDERLTDEQAAELVGLIDDLSEPDADELALDDFEDVAADYALALEEVRDLYLSYIK